MHAIHVHIHVKPESVDDFLAVTLDNARNSILEPGVARFDVFQYADDPTRFVLNEIYRTDDAPAQHRETAHYQRWRDTVSDMMAEPRQRVELINVFPGIENS